MTLQENKDIKQLVHNDYKDNSDYKTTNLQSLQIKMSIIVTLDKLFIPSFSCSELEITKVYIDKGHECPNTNPQPPSWANAH